MFKNRKGHEQQILWTMCAFTPPFYIVIPRNEFLKSRPNTDKLGWVKVDRFNDCASPSLVVKLVENGRVGAVVLVAVIGALCFVELELVPPLNCGGG